MIELKQFRENEFYGFEVSGFRHEMFHLQRWLAHFEYGNKLLYNVGYNPNRPASDDQYTVVRGKIVFNEDVAGMLKNEFAAMFKLAFFKFELELPDNTNSVSEAMERIEQIGEVVHQSVNAGQPFDSDLLNGIKTAIDSNKLES